MKKMKSYAITINLVSNTAVAEERWGLESLPTSHATGQNIAARPAKILARAGRWRLISGPARPIRAESGLRATRPMQTSNAQQSQK